MKRVMLSNNRSKQSGVALAIGIILLAVASVTAVMSMRTTTTQERISSNQRNKTVSLMAAESGATQIMQRLTNITDESVEEILDGFPATPQSAYVLTDGTGGAWFISNISPGAVTSGLRRILIDVTGLTLENPTSSIILGESIIRLEIEDQAPTSSGTEEEPLPALLSQGNIGVNGNIEIVGDGHANGRWNITGGNNTVQGRITTSSGNTSGLRGTTISTAPNINVPLVTERYAADLSPPGGFVNCNPATFVNGRTYYCSNSVTISNSLTGVKVVSQQNITINASVLGSTFVSLGTTSIGQSAQLGSAAAPVRLGSQGNFSITGGGNINIWGDLLTNGTTIRNGGGRSTITGSVHSSGSMTWNGQLRIFATSGGANDDPGPDDTTNTFRRTIVEWRELGT